MPGPRPQVSIRLATSGKGEVQKDFADIADAGSVQAARLRAKWEAETAEIERRTAAAAKTFERMAAASTPSVQRQVNQSTGVASGVNPAAASVSALDNLMKEAERDAQRLIAAVDPLFAAQGRYATNVARINELKNLGVIDNARYVQLLEVEEQALDSATRAQTRHNGVNGQARMGMQQLGFQLGDMATMWSLGAKGSQIFASQLGQTVQAVQLMGGESNKFLRFLGGPWGIALSVAAIVLTPLIGKLFEAGNAVDDLVAKQAKEAQAARDQETANRIWANSLDGVREAIRANKKALDEMADSGKTAARRAFEGAIAAAEHAKRVREDTAALLKNAEAQELALRAQVAGSGGGSMRDSGAAAELTIVEGRLKDIRAQLAGADQAIVDADANLKEAQGRRLAELFSADAVDKIKRTYDDPRTGLIALAGQQATAEEQVNGTLKRRVELLAKERDAKVKAAQDAEKDPPKNAGGTAIFDAQISSFFDTAAKYRGLSETRNKGVLEALFTEANMTLDPEKTAWCAAFVNAVLATNGVKGTGSLAASSFLNFGKDDTRSPQKGDIAVVKSGGSPSGQHVGFVESVDAKGNVRVLGGNTGDRVGSATYGKNDILAIRRPPTPSEAAKAGETTADKALKAQNDFEEQLAQLHVAQLQAELQNVLGAQAKAKAAEEQIQAEEDRAKTAIQNNLEEGKYGDATSQLAQERAKQLTDAVEQTAAAKRTTLATQNLMRSLQEGDERLAQLSQFKVEELQHVEKYARTAEERRDIQLQILDLEYAEKQRHLEVAKNLELMAGNYAKAAEIQDQINNLPKEKARDQQDAKDATKSPWEAYLDELPKTVGEIDEALEKAAVGGLQKFNDGLLDVLMHSDSLKDAWHNMGALIHSVAEQILSDLLRLAEREAMMALFGGGQQQGAAGGGGGGSIWGTIINGIGSAAGAIFGGGGGSSSAGSSGGGGGGGWFGLASGTEHASGGWTWVGENGKELVRLPSGSKVSPAAESRRMAAAANDVRPVFSPTIHNDFRGADAAAVGAITARLDQFEADMPGKVVKYWTDARERFAIRV